MRKKINMLYFYKFTALVSYLNIVGSNCPPLYSI